MPQAQTRIPCLAEATSRSGFRRFATTTLCLVLTASLAGATVHEPTTSARGYPSAEYVLWEPAPAPNSGHGEDPILPRRPYSHDSDWESWSYPLANGTLGANVFGRTDVERVQLSEKTFANKGIYQEGGLTNAAELYLDIGHETFTDYRRELNLNTGVKTVRYSSCGVRYEREYFTSHPDGLLAIRLNADQPGALSLTVRPEIPHIPSREPGGHKTAETVVDGSDIRIAGTIDFFQTRFALQVRVLQEGGTQTSGEKTLSVHNADTVTLLVAIGTNYELRPEVFLNAPKEKLDPAIDPAPAVEATIARAEALGFDALKSRHIADHRGLFERVSIHLNSEPSHLPTHQLLADYQAGLRSNYLEELMFQYGRYLIIASSRADTLPAHLQGAWTQHEMTPWSGGYWHNINVQMNYWGSNITDLPETFEAYTRYFQAYLPTAIEYAQEFMQERRPERFSEIPEENGWTFGNGANAYHLPKTSAHSGPGTQAFVTIMLMEYFNFTQDKTFLREVAYPAMRMLSQFYAKALIESEDGLLLVEDSASPEIRHPFPGGDHYKTIGCTYDQSLVWQNHTDLLRAAEILGIEDDPFLDLVRSQIPRLDPILIGASGQIKEFREENEYGDIGQHDHRHISQLVGLYPGDLINASNPEWMQAASRTLDLRGNRATGWAQAHRMNARARLKEAEKAHEVFGRFIKEKTLPNLWTVHPPFQIDGNLGVMAGVAEMLLQSHQGYIEPLPALPAAWHTGHFDGLVARGNFKVSAQWEAGRLTKLSILSRSGKPCDLKVPGVSGASILKDDGSTVSFQKEGSDQITFPTVAGATYTIQL